MLQGHKTPTTVNHHIEYVCSLAIIEMSENAKKTFKHSTMTLFWVGVGFRENAESLSWSGDHRGKSWKAAFSQSESLHYAGGMTYTHITSITTHLPDNIEVLELFDLFIRRCCQSCGRCWRISRRWSSPPSHHLWHPPPHHPGSSPLHTLRTRHIHWTWTSSRTRLPPARRSRRRARREWTELHRPDMKAASASSCRWLLSNASLWPFVILYWR